MGFFFNWLCSLIAQLLTRAIQVVFGSGRWQSKFACAWRAGSRHLDLPQKDRADIPRESEFP